LRDLDKLLVEDQKMTNVFAPSVAVNKTFEKWIEIRWFLYI